MRRKLRPMANDIKFFSKIASPPMLSRNNTIFISDKMKSSLILTKLKLLFDFSSLTEVNIPTICEFTKIVDCLYRFNVEIAYKNCIKV